MRTPMEVRVPLLLVAATAAVAVVAGALDAREFIPSVYGMQQLRLFCDTQAKLDTVRRYANDPSFDFLRLPHGTSEPVEVLVTANRLASFKEALRAAGIGYRVLVADMSRTILQERNMQNSARMVRSRSSIDSGSDAEYMKYFPRYEEIKMFVEAVGKQYPNVCRAFSLGYSSEGRELVAIKFSTNGSAADDGEVGGKPALLIDAGIHAREWVAPLTAIYMIKQLAENATNHQLFQDIDIYIAPLLNPDGYEFSHVNISTRLWRKTRSLQPGSECQGVDANRNFDLYWNTAGAGPNPCNHLYAGSRPFSEPETRALRDFILARRDRIKTYLTLHSYGNYMLHPWGYSKKYPKNTPTLRCAAQAAASALFKVRGTRYTIGSSANVLYPAAGGSDDYAMGVAGIDLAYTIELPSKEYGFFPPPQEILPIGEETFEAVKEFARYVKGEICQNIPEVEEQ